MNTKLIAIGQLLGFYGLLLYLGGPIARLTPHLYLLAAIGVCALIYQPAFQTFDKGTDRDRGTARQILWTIQITQTAGHLEAVFYWSPACFDWTVITSVGLAIATLGLAIRTWAVLHLGSAFTWHIDPEQAQELITTGPFRMVRHPSYTGAFCLYAGSLLLLQAYFSLALAVVAMPIAFRRRIRLEEQALEETFQDQYRAYCQRVGAVIPGLGRRKP